MGKLASLLAATYVAELAARRAARAATLVDAAAAAGILRAGAEDMPRRADEARRVDTERIADRANMLVN
jgi:hypothetical protein